MYPLFCFTIPYTVARPKPGAFACRLGGVEGFKNVGDVREEFLHRHH